MLVEQMYYSVGGFLFCKVICLKKSERNHKTNTNRLFAVFWNQIAELKRGAEIIVCTPGRMIDMLAANNGE